VDDALGVEEGEAGEHLAGEAADQGEGEAGEVVRADELVEVDGEAGRDDAEVRAEVEGARDGEGGVGAGGVLSQTNVLVSAIQFPSNHACVKRGYRV